MSGAYRDALGGLRALLEARVEEIEALDARIDPTFWDAAPPAVVADVDALRSEIEAASAGDTDLTRAEAAAARLLARLKQLIDELPEYEATASQLPDNFVDLPLDPSALSRNRVFRTSGFPAGVLPSLRYMAVGEPWRPEFGVHEVVRPYIDEITSLARGLDPAAYVVDVHYWGRRLELTVNRTPIALLLEALPGVDATAYLGEVRHTLGTSLPLATPKVVVEPQETRHDLLKLLPFNLVEDVELGDDLFDGMFLVRGAAISARRVLTRPVRRALVALAHFDVPRLHTAPGHAVVAFGCGPERHALLRACEVLSSLRDADFRARYLSGIGPSAKGQLT